MNLAGDIIIRNEKGRVPLGLVFPREYNFLEYKIMIIRGHPFLKN